MKNLIKKLLSFLPKDIEKKSTHIIKMIFIKEYRWMINNYWKFGQDNRKKIFFSAARYMNINRPINGYYFEFGCNEANTFRMAYNIFKNLFKLKYVAFDSFEGLPEVKEIDKMEVFYEGKLAFDESKFIKLVKKEGIKDEELIVVKGFYKNTLNQELIDKLNPTKAAVIYVDCDLYSSTVDVLKFIKHFLQPGTILIFDDWNCFYGDKNRGQKKAFYEFLNLNKDLVFEEFITDCEAKSFVYINNKNEAQFK